MFNFHGLEGCQWDFIDTPGLVCVMNPLSEFFLLEHPPNPQVTLNFWDDSPMKNGEVKSLAFWTIYSSQFKQILTSHSCSVVK